MGVIGEPVSAARAGTTRPTGAPERAEIRGRLNALRYLPSVYCHRSGVPSPQKIVPSPRKFTEDPLCDVRNPRNGAAIFAVPRLNLLCSSQMVEANEPGTDEEMIYDAFGRLTGHYDLITSVWSSVLFPRGSNSFAFYNGP